MNELNELNAALSSFSIGCLPLLIIFPMGVSRLESGGFG